MSPARLRLAAFLLLAVTAGGLFLAWSQAWFTFGLLTGPLAVRGDIAAPALPPLALVTLAMILALALAGTGFRIVLGALEVLVGVAAIVTSAFALGNPVAASSPALAKAVGVTGAGSVDFVTTVSTSGWPIVAIVAGILAVLAGLVVAVTARRWPTSSRRFSRTRTEPDGTGADDAVETDPVREWDALSEGDDPTRPTP